MRKMRKAHSRRRNIVTLTILLLIFFLIDNMLMSLSNYEIDHMQEHLEARTLIVRGIIYLDDPDASQEEFEKLEEYLEHAPGIVSWIRREDAADFTFSSGGDDISFDVIGCDYEAICDYVLTEDCHAPEGNEVIIAKYYTTAENKIDIGSYLISFNELNREKNALDGEELVGQMITGNVSCWVLGDDPGYITMEKELKVIGVFDNYAMGRESSLFVNVDTLASWDAEAESRNTFVPEEDVIYLELYETYPHAITCETRADLLALESYIDENFETLSYCCSSSLLEEVCLVFQSMMMIANFILIFFLINLAINIVYTEEREVYIRRREYGLMKAVGYEDFQLGLLHMKETWKNVLQALLATFLIGSVIIFVLNVLMAPLLNVLYYTFRIKIQASVCAIVVLAALASVSVGSIRGLIQVCRMQAVDALKEED